MSSLAKLCVFLLAEAMLIGGAFLLPDYRGLFIIGAIFSALAAVLLTGDSDLEKRPPHW